MASVVIVSKRQKKLQASYKSKGYLEIDVTSSSDQLTYQKFSPFYPHGNIPIPGMPGKYAQSVEGIWQGLKVFEKEGVDVKKFDIASMKNIKRTTGEKRGKVLGHLFANDIIPYVTARKQIYLPAYSWVLDQCLSNEISLLRGLLQEGKQIMLLDYETNEDIDDTSKPLSHASLIKAALNSLKYSNA